MKFLVSFVLICVLLGAQGLAAEREQTPFAKELNREFHGDGGLAARKLDQWVFEEGLADAVRRVRVEDAVWLLSKSYRAAHVDAFLQRLSQECGAHVWAWKEAGQLLAAVSGSGVMEKGEFVRGRGRGENWYSYQRDDALERQAYLKAMDLMVDDETVAGGVRAELYLAFAATLDEGKGAGVMKLTDLNAIPEVTTQRPWGLGSDPLIDGRTPVVGPGDVWRLPVLRATFEEARTDYERAYWLLNEARVQSPAHAPAANLHLAQIWAELLGVEGLEDADYIYLEGTESEFDPSAPGEFELHTLQDHQTFVIGEKGPKRMVIPEEYRYLAMLRRVLLDEKTPPEICHQAYRELEDLLCNRNQNDAAEEIARVVVEKKMGTERTQKEAAFLPELIGPEGRFLDTGPFAFGNEVVIEFLSREIAEQEFVLWKLDFDKVEGSPDDHFLGSSSYRFEDDKPDPRRMCRKLATWTVAIRKKANHLQTMSRIEVPVKEAGNYLLVAGNQYLPLQVARSILISVPMEGGPSWGKGEPKGNFFLADALTGLPVAGAEIESEGGVGAKFVSDHTGYVPGLRAGGDLVVRRDGMAPELLAADADWFEALKEDEISTLFVANQPFYRPGQTVRFAGWVRRPNWKGARSSLFGEGSELRIVVVDPVGQVIYREDRPLDEFNGFEGEFELGTEVVLGNCQVQMELSDIAAATRKDPFDDESELVKAWTKLELRKTISIGEFRKPDFQVTTVPESGNRQAVVVQANYHSGEPLKGARVVGRIKTHPLNNRRTWPKRPWDELYWAGYEWPLPKLDWISGWSRWGIWTEDQEEEEDDDEFWYGNQMERKARGVTDDEGRARLEFPDVFPFLGSFDYDCRVEVVVQEFTGRSVASDRHHTYSGRPYEIFLQPTKGFLRLGEPLELDLWTLDSERNPVAGEGELRIERLDFEGDKPVFTPLLSTPEKLKDGHRRLSLELPFEEAGQYRCVFEGGGSTRGFVLEVIGEKRRLGRYDGVQLIPRDAAVKNGEEVEVLIQTDEKVAQVWLFESLADGRRRTPRLIETKDQLATVRLPVRRWNEPEFYLLAAVVSNGRLKEARCRIVVPPVEQRLEVVAEHTSGPAKPGGRGTVEIQVNDHKGQPAAAVVAVAIYDRALGQLTKPYSLSGMGRTSHLRDRFELYETRVSSSVDEISWRDAIERLNQPGCFNWQGGLIGDPRWQPTGRFERLGRHLWYGYEPPELPNQISADPDGFGAFPASLAGPDEDRLRARQGDLTPEEEALLDRVSLRKNYADSIYWGGSLRTDEAGKVVAEFSFADNLTTWKVRSWAFGKGLAMGDGEDLEIPVSKEVQLRPLVPRAAVVGDVLEIGVLIQNLSKKKHDFQISFSEGRGEEEVPKIVTLGAGAEGRATWSFLPVEAGSARLQFRVRSGDGSLVDGAEVVVPVSAGRAPVTVAFKGEVDPLATSTVLNVKVDKAVPEKATLQVQLEADPALGALSVIPDLVRYPHGCTEQTLNRFLPTLIAWQSAEKLGLDWSAMKRVMARDDRSLGWIRGRARESAKSKDAGMSEEEVRGMIYVGLNRLKELQGEDGQWGWFSARNQEHNVYLSALAVRGIARAKKHGFSLTPDPRDRGVSFLQSQAYLRVQALKVEGKEAQALDAFVLSALAEAGVEAKELKGALLKRVPELPPTGIIHLALTLSGAHEKAQREQLYELLKVRRADGDGPALTWWNDSVEQRAWLLKLRVAMKADPAEIRQLIRSLLEMRSDGIRWSNTRSSALCVEAIVEAGVQSGGFGVGGEEGVEIPVVIEAGGERRVVKLGRGELWSGRATIEIEKDDWQEGIVPVTVRREGDHAISVSAALSYQSREPGLMQAKTAGIAVERTYSRVDPDGGRTLLEKGERLRVGDLIEVKLQAVGQGESDHHFVHLLDPLPAGLEPVHQSSGYERGAYRESRLGETHFYFSRLSRWNEVQRYFLRAVTPGKALALPARAECMYSPEIWGQSEHVEVEVE